MAWLTWRQHRPQLLATAGLLLLLAVAAVVTELPIRAAYHRHALSSCLPPATRSGCELIVGHFRSEYAARVGMTRYLAVLPALAGLFIGAPLLAREFESGTFRLAWTQSLSRRRWVLSRTLLLALATVVAAAWRSSEICSRRRSNAERARSRRRSASKSDCRALFHVSRDA